MILTTPQNLRPAWRFVIAIVFMIATLLTAGRAMARADDAVAASTVQLTVDFHDGVRKSFSVPWSEGMTVLDTLTRAQASPHGLTFKYSGSGATAFVTQIDDVKNQGGGAEARNWIFSVNGTLADRGCGVFKLEKRDAVLWKFDKYTNRAARRY